MKHLGVLLGLDAGTPGRAFDHLDVEPDLLLEGPDLPLRGAAQLLAG